MAEVSARTFHSSGGVAKGAAGSFDVRSWQGLTKLLKAGKESGMDQDAYAKFRDLVLSYATSGGTDGALRSQIEALTAQFNIHTETETRSKKLPVQKVEPKKVPVFAAEPPAPTTKSDAHPIGISRPRPQFGAHPPVGAPTKRPQQQAVPHNLPTVPHDAAPKHQDVHPVTTTIPVVPIKETLIPKVPTTSPSESKKETIAAPMPPAAPVSVDAPAIHSIDEAKARIAEIKHEVNVRVGNPIALVDAGNAVGREYMSALLTAMKAVNGSAPGRLEPAMQTLEVLYQKIMAMSLESLEKQAATIHKDQSIPPPPKMVQAPKDTSSVSVQEELPEKKPVMPQKPPEPTDTRSIPTTEIPQPARSLPHGPHAIPSLADTDTSPTPRSEPSISLAPQRKEEKITQNVPGVLGSTPPQRKPPPPSGPPLGERMSPPPGATDDLEAPDVTQGLNQLLSEWSIFHSSGIFGTGSGGHEHPLYKKIGPLPMSIVIGGSWEGAQNEAVFSIRDYVNGWLHEQGVAYLPEESFEHYLRRVVKRILRRKGG